MKFLSRRRAAKNTSSVQVSEKDGVRSLHFNSITVQSSMRVAKPFDLELDYTRRMMAFLFFLPQPQHIRIIGLGGGSLAKFIHLRLPKTRVTAVEIDPEVVAIAHSQFLLPAEDERLAIIVGDAASHMAEGPEPCDVIMVDGYDAHAIDEALAAEDFYRHCHANLSANGVLIANFWRSAPGLKTYLDRLEHIFGAHVLQLPSVTHGNLVVFAFKNTQGSPAFATLAEKAVELEDAYGLLFTDFLQSLREHNLHTEKRLLV